MMFVFTRENGELFTLLFSEGTTAITFAENDLSIVRVTDFVTKKIIWEKPSV